MQYIKTEKIDNINLSKDNFYVAIDFDKTITDTKSCDSWDASANTLGEDFKKESSAMYKKYSPIELDYTISFEEKIKAMRQWYYGVMDLYFKYNLTEEKLQKSINNSKIIFREGAKEFLENLNDKNIQVVVLSAGIGNVIEQFLKTNNCYFPNMKIISNFLKFDESGKILKQNENIIHTLNKTMEGHISEKFAKELNDKKYRLLFGDCIEDKNMVPKEEWDKTISIGFLGRNIENNFEIYKQNFDIVLTRRRCYI